MGDLAIVAGTANQALVREVTARLGASPTRASVERFPDGELSVALVDPVSEADVFIVQPLSPPAADHLFELLLLADACRAGGAARVHAVVPYLAYARQDRRGPGPTALGGRVLAEALGTGRFAHLVVADLHSASLEGFFDLPVTHLSAVPTLVEAMRGELPPDLVVVAPDLGAVKPAELVASALGAPLATIQKTRLSGSKVSVRAVVGPVIGRRPLIVDDMLVTAGTIVAASEALLAQGCVPEITVAVTHTLPAGEARERLARVPIRRLYTTDTVGTPVGLPLEVRMVSAAPLLAGAILLQHRGAPEPIHRVAGEGQ